MSSAYEIVYPVHPVEVFEKGFVHEHEVFVINEPLVDRNVVRVGVLEQDLIDALVTYVIGRVSWLPQTYPIVLHSLDQLLLLARLRG